MERDPDKEEAAPPPSLRNPGEKLPQDPNVVPSTSQKDVGVMKPVQFPKPNPDTQPGANPDSVPDTQPDASSTRHAPNDFARAREDAVARRWHRSTQLTSLPEQPTAGVAAPMRQPLDSRGGAGLTELL